MKSIMYTALDKFINEKTLVNDDELVVIKARAFVLGAIISCFSLLVFVSSNLVKGYYEPIPIQLFSIGFIFILLFSSSKDISRPKIYNFGMVCCVLYFLFVGYHAGDYLRLLPWWGTFLMLFALLVENNKDVLIWAIILYIAALVSLTFGSSGVLRNGYENITLVFLLSIGVQTFYLKRKTILLEKLNKAAEEIKTLRGIIPICSHCKHIRDDNGAWSQVEEYVSEHTGAEFTHGICPDCMEKHHPEEYKEILQKKRSS